MTAGVIKALLLQRGVQKHMDSYNTYINTTSGGSNIHVLSTVLVFDWNEWPDLSLFLLRVLLTVLGLSGNQTCN